MFRGRSAVHCCSGWVDAMCLSKSGLPRLIHNLGMRKNHMKSNARMRLVTIMVALVIGSNAWAQTTVTGSFDTNRISYAAGDETVKSLLAQAYTDVPDMLVWFEVAEGQAV